MVDIFGVMRASRGGTRRAGSAVERFRFDKESLAGGLGLHVFVDPGFPTLAGGGVAPAEDEARDFRIRNRQLVAGWQKQAHGGRLKRGAGAAVENVAFDGLAILARDRDIAAVMKGLL